MYKGYLYPYSYTSQPLTNTDSRPRANTQEWLSAKGSNGGASDIASSDLAALADVNKTACDHHLAFFFIHHLAFIFTADRYADAGPAPLPPLPWKTGKNKQTKTTCPCRQSISSEISMAKLHNGSISTTITFFFFLRDLVQSAYPTENVQILTSGRKRGSGCHKMRLIGRCGGLHH